MTLPISLTPSAVLPATNIHPHGHHRGGSQLGTLLDPTASTDGGTSTSSTSGTSSVSRASATQPAPDGSTQGLFSTIFNSLEGVIGANTGIQLGSILNTKA